MIVQTLISPALAMAYPQNSAGTLGAAEKDKKETYKSPVGHRVLVKGFGIYPSAVAHHPCTK